VTNVSSFYLQDGGKKSTGMDMEQNYVIVTRQYFIRYSLFYVTPQILAVKNLTPPHLTKLSRWRCELDSRRLETVAGGKFEV